MALSLEQINLEDICKECLALIDGQAEKRGISITSDLAPCTINADYTRFKQVLLNLLSNAVKYNREGGSVTLACTMIDDTVRVSVRDTGEGIAKDKQRGLFEPFNRLGKESGDIEGTGIGLTITRQLVEAMDGRVGFETSVGEGSTFWVEMDGTATSESEIAPPPGTSQGDRMKDPTADCSTVLYIEDSHANQQLMKMLVEKMDGVTLVLAETAELGLTMVEERRPDLILMDINLPGMDGIAATNVLASMESTKDIPVIAITAAAMESDIEKGLAAGFKAYLTKPFVINDVVGAIEKHLPR